MMEKSLDPPRPTHFAINSNIKVLIMITREAEPIGNRTGAKKWAEEVLSSLGLDGSFFLNYRYHDQEYDFVIIGEGSFDPGETFRKSDFNEFNEFDPEHHIIKGVSGRLMKFDIYDEDFQINIDNYETVDV